MALSNAFHYTPGIPVQPGVPFTPNTTNPTPRPPVGLGLSIVIRRAEAVRVEGRGEWTQITLEA